MSRQPLAMALAALALAAVPDPARAERFALIVAGASGDAAHAERHAAWTSGLTTTLVERLKFDRRRVTVLADGNDAATNATAENVRRTLEAVRREMAAGDLLFIVLIGHGTFDGSDAKFNLVGPDLESAQWSELLADLPGQVVLVNTTAGSFPFIERLAGERRIVITATDSPAGQFDTVFPEYFIAALGDDAADIDKNGRVSIWEAFTAATAAVRRHFQQRGQLATERALLDDNGDGVGRDATGGGDDGSMASRTYLEEPLPGAAPTDEVLVQLLQKRAAVEAELDELRVRRAFMRPDEYQKEFERLIIDLARVSRDIRERIKS